MVRVVGSSMSVSNGHLYQYENAIQAAEEIVSLITTALDKLDIVNNVSDNAPYEELEDAKASLSDIIDHLRYGMLIMGRRR